MDANIQKLKSNQSAPTEAEIDASLASLGASLENEQRKTSKKEDDMLEQLRKLLFGEN